MVGEEQSQIPTEMTEQMTSPVEPERITTKREEATTEPEEPPIQTEGIQIKKRKDDDGRVYFFFEPSVRFTRDPSFKSSLFLS